MHDLTVIWNLTFTIKGMCVQTSGRDLTKMNQMVTRLFRKSTGVNKYLESTGSKAFWKAVGRERPPHRASPSLPWEEEAGTGSLMGALQGPSAAQVGTKQKWEGREQDGASRVRLGVKQRAWCWHARSTVELTHLYEAFGWRVILLW